MKDEGKARDVAEGREPNTTPWPAEDVWLLPSGRGTSASNPPTSASSSQLGRADG